MTEVGIVLCEDCWRTFSPCSDLSVPMDEHDENAVYHGKVGTFVRNGVVNWTELMPELN